MILPTKSRRWSYRVGQVFNTRPRDGSNTNILWIKRRNIEELLIDLLLNPGVHICIDGPTGTGKSSLAITTLSSLGIQYNMIQITESMTWQDFCKELVGSSSNRESSYSIKFNIGLKNSLPILMLEGEAESKERHSDHIELINRIAENTNEHDICKLLAKHNVILFIDDFERASPDLITRISDMCKLLTQSYQNDFSKILVVGTDDICRKLFEANKSLVGRLEQVSVGTLGSPGESWWFLKEGFERLDLFYPGNSKIQKHNASVSDCVQSVYQAADGLPKSLNQLGRSISKSANHRSGISPSDISESAERHFAVALSSKLHLFPSIVKCIKQNVVAQAVLRCLYDQDIGKIHNRSELSMALETEFSEQQIEHALIELIELKFLVRKGEQGNILFTTEPEFAHILGLIMTGSCMYTNNPSVARFRGQLTAQFCLPLHQNTE